MMEFMMTLAVIALIFVIATIMVALAAGALLKLRKAPPAPTENLNVENLRICARNTPWP